MNGYENRISAMNDMGFHNPSNAIARCGLEKGLQGKQAAAF